MLLVTLDTTRPDHLGCYGYARPTSPVVDSVAARGTLFENAWAQAPETGPSLASVLSSRRAPVTGVRGNAERLVEDLPTLATIAHDAGLRTGAFVSTVLLRRDACAFDRGFDVYDDQMTDPCFGHDRAQRVAAKTVDQALAWLRAADEPFVLWVHLYDPHGPYAPPEPMPALDATRESVPSQPLRREWIPAYQRMASSSLDARDYVDRYDREIAYADRELGRLLSAVDPATTVIAIHADHGEALGEDDYWFRHGNLLHDAALRVPMVLAGPGVPDARRVTEPARNLDLVPTLLALAALPALPDAEGRDLLRPTPPGAEFQSIAEARRRQIVGDSTGIDTRWKLRMLAPGVDLTWWPATDEHLAVGRLSESDRNAAKATLREWLREPARAAPDVAPTADDLPDALRGLGYR